MPADIITAFPTIMPFASPTNYQSYAQSLGHKKLATRDGELNSPDLIKIDAILVFNDPRDWILDAQIILDLLLSKDGFLGSVSPKNDTPSLPNRGYLQDGQPPLYFSNPDLLWAAEYHLPRIGQGGFREALEGVWEAITGGPKKSVNFEAKMFGKPHHGTFEFAEKRLQDHQIKLKGLDGAQSDDDQLKRVYMIGGKYRRMLCLCSVKI